MAAVISVVVPAYNEADHLAESLAGIRAALDGIGEPLEIVVVDDGSTDGTWDTLVATALRMPELRAIALSRNFGKEAAIAAGLDEATGDAVILMDCDLQHPPRLIPELVRLWRQDGYKIVNAVKARRPSETIVGRWGARLFYGLFQRLSGMPLAGASDFKLLDREVVEIYRKLPERRLFFRGMVPWFGFPQGEVRFEVPDRKTGQSKWSIGKRIYLALDALSSFSAAPLQFVTAAGIAFLLFAVLLGGQTVYTKLAGGAVEGFATVILLVLITGAILMLSLGIIGQYLAKIYDEIKRRPRYLVRSEIRTGQGSAAGTDAADDRYTSNPSKLSSRS